MTAAIWLDHGKVARDGAIRPVLNEYRSLSGRELRLSVSRITGTDGADPTEIDFEDTATGVEIAFRHRQ